MEKLHWKFARLCPSFPSFELQESTAEGGPRAAILRRRQEGRAAERPYDRNKYRFVEYRFFRRCSIVNGMALRMMSVLNRRYNRLRVESPYRNWR
ncbi:MAG: hypothetical protein JWM11_303 [Planctomycetaceae bacterium]|nr:hypothetical protein [Planctomycetaceae bacterium]